MDEAAVKALVDGAIQHRELGILGERTVNVLALNQSLDASDELSKVESPGTLISAPGLADRRKIAIMPDDKRSGRQALARRAS